MCGEDGKKERKKGERERGELITLVTNDCEMHVDTRRGIAPCGMCSLLLPGIKIIQRGKVYPEVRFLCCSFSFFYRKEISDTTNKQISLNPREPISILESVNRSSA